MDEKKNKRFLAVKDIQFLVKKKERKEEIYSIK